MRRMTHADSEPEASGGPVPVPVPEAWSLFALVRAVETPGTATNAKATVMHHTMLMTMVINTTKKTTKEGERERERGGRGEGGGRRYVVAWCGMVWHSVA